MSSFITQRSDGTKTVLSRLLGRLAADNFTLLV
jgi:hypothetical protein